MTKRLDALIAREYTDRDGNKKSAFTKIGVAFETAKGWALTLEALPLPTMGERGLETKILLMPPKEQNGSKPQRERSYADQSRGGYGAEEIDF